MLRKAGIHGVRLFLGNLLHGKAFSDSTGPNNGGARGYMVVRIVLLVAFPNGT